MTDSDSPPTAEMAVDDAVDEPVAAEAPAAAAGAAAVPPPWTVPENDGGVAVSDRPEVKIGGAFAGGLVLALILKRLAR